MIRETTRGKVRKGLLKDIPLITYSMNKTDFALFRKGLKMLGRFYLGAGADKLYLPSLAGGIWVENEEELDRYVDGKRKPRDFLMSAYHPPGTARIGATPELGVCAQNNKVHDWDGLYVIDGSNIPSALSANPQLTIMAMAGRAAKKLADEMVG